MESQILIEELSPADSNIITESDKNGKNLYLSGVFLMGNQKNRNGRVYPISELANTVANISNRISESNGILGELDHPDNLNINLANTSHLVTELKMIGDNCIGRAKIINTPSGNILRALIESGVKIGVSSRGSGEVDSEGIVSNYACVTIDAVATPSGQLCQPDIIRESLEKNKKVLTLAESLIVDPAAQKYFKKEMHKFIENMVDKGAFTIKK